MRLLPIVEGPGDIEALPILLRRLLNEHSLFEIDVLRPYKWGDVYKVARNFRRYSLTAAKERAGILWAIDLDDGCPVEWVKLFEEQLPEGVDVPVEFVFFIREYECLFLADKTCLLDLGVPADLEFPADPESIRGVKEWISRQMPSGTSYKETVHQAKLSSKIDLSVVRNASRSFRHLESSVLKLVKELAL
jgi:hypothetical protein